MANAADLTKAILTVCPVDGVAVGRWDDRASWRIDFKAEATDEQRAAAQAALGAFDPDAPSVPASVHMWQAKAALAAVGKLDAANAAVAQAPQSVQLAWAYAPEISRNSPAVAQIGAAIGIKEADMDALFIAAEAIIV